MFIVLKLLSSVWSEIQV